MNIIEWNRRSKLIKQKGAVLKSYRLVIERKMLSATTASDVLFNLHEELKLV